MFESKINRGRANGYAPLDSGSKVPLSYLPPIQSTIDTGSFVTTSSFNDYTASVTMSANIDTASFATTGSNTFTGDQTISTIQGTGSLYLKPDSADSRDFRIYNTEPSDIHLKGNAAYSFFGDDTNYLKIDDNNSEITLRANSTIILETGNGDIIFNPDSGLYKGYADAGNVLITKGLLDSATGSLVTATSFNEYTASVTMSANIDTASFATTGSNTFVGNQTINGSLTILTPSAGIPNSVSNWNGQGGWNQGSYPNLSTTGGTGTGLTVDVAAGGGGYINIEAITINTPGSGYSSGDVITIDNENNLPGTFTIGIEESGWIFDNSGSLTTPGDINVSGSIYADNLDGLISSSTQIDELGFATTSSVVNIDTSSLLLTSSFNTYTSSLIGSISGSSQITKLGFASTSSLAVVTPFLSSSTFNTFTSSYTTHSSSFDSRINSIVNGSGFATTSSFNSFTSSINSYSSSINTFTASINTTTASLNLKTGSFATTGSNQFNGNQSITGSLTVNSGTIISSSLTTNSSSLFLNSGSNLYVQNNGVVEITGSLIVSGSATLNVPVLYVGTGSGDEGGEINLAIPVTNTTLQNRVAVDIFQNRLRIFEGSADAKGVYIDLSKAPAGNSGELTWKASGLVGRGTDVTLGNLKVRIASSGNISLQLSTISGTYSVYGSGIYSQAGTVIGATIDGGAPLSITTTPAYLKASYSFGTAGSTDTWVIMDTSNTIAWRITMVLGAGVTNNLITIERLH